MDLGEGKENYLLVKRFWVLSIIGNSPSELEARSQLSTKRIQEDWEKALGFKGWKPSLNQVLLPLGHFIDFYASN